MTDEIDETLPEAVKAFLRRGAQLEDIRLSAEGQWTHEGLDFDNPKIIALFNRSIGRTAGGTWVLEVGPFTYPIEVDDTPYFVERIQRSESERAHIWLSDGTDEDLQYVSLVYAPHGRLYCDVKGGAFRARFKRAAYYELAEAIEPRGDGWVLVDAGHTHEIRTLPDY